MKPFEYVNAITSTKQNIIKDSENPALAESFYNPYLTNKALSFYVDSIQYANEMNFHALAPNKLQFDYLINTIRQKKRKNQWIKKAENDSDIDNISRYFKVSLPKAREIVKVLSPSDIEIIKAKIIKGGVHK